MMASGGGCKSLYVGMLDARVDELLLAQVFSVAGTVTSVKIIPDRSHLQNGLNFGFVDFADHSSAEAALQSLNGRKIYDSVISVNWAFGGAGGASHRPREDTSSHFHLWIGDLSADVDDPTLQKAFSNFQTISDCRVMFDTVTGKSRGYGFVSFRDRHEAEQALQTMNGEFVGKKQIRLNWANNRGASSSGTTAAGYSGGYGGAGKPQLNYQAVAAQTPPFHTTVYIGGLPPSTTQDHLMSSFQQYGFIMDIKIHNDRGFAFVKFDNHESAAMAICYLHGQIINGARVKCSWGRDKNAEAMMFSVQQQQSAGMPAGYGSAPAATAQAPNAYYSNPAAVDPNAYAAYYDPNAYAAYYASMQQQYGTGQQQ